MLYAEDFRRIARRQLGYRWTGNKWGTFALITFVYTLIEAGISFLSRFYIGTVVGLVVSGPFSLGFAIVALNTVRGGSPQVSHFFDGFKNFGTAFVLNLLNSLFIFLWSLLLIIPGIIKIFEYSMSFYILRDHPEMSAGDIRRASIAMMYGNKWRLLCLEFSFIGWYLLGILTFGILLFWVIPYYQTAIAVFYESIKPNNYRY